MKTKLTITITLAVLAAFSSSCTKNPPPKPWEIVCDGHGHYNFNWKDGTPWMLDEFATRDEAAAYRDSVQQVDARMTVEERTTRADAISDAEMKALDAKVARVQSRHWQRCP